MNLTEFADLVQRMRKAQTDYFTKGRTNEALRSSKALEKLVDDAVKKLLPLTAGQVTQAPDLPWED